MGFPQPPPHAKPLSRPGPVLRLPFLLPIILGLALIVGPAAYWSGTYLPSLFQHVEIDWPDPGVIALVIALASTLILIPAIWVWRARMIDVLAMTLIQNALIFCGYFFLETTAVHIKVATTGILRMAGLAVMINAVGFAVFFVALFFSYQMAVRLRGRIAPLRHTPEILDRRLAWFLRGMSLFCIVLLVLPMALTHSIPLFEGSEARLKMDSSAIGRPLYNLGTALLPFILGGLAIIVLRGSRRILRWEVFLMVILVLIQLLTTNRYPLSLALLIICSLISMERRWPRWLLVGILGGYIAAFTVLSGFTEILRLDPRSITPANAIPASVRQAFLGDNIIELRDFSWVLSCWNFDPLIGKTYAGGAFSLVPSAIFPERKQWHLGMTAIRIVGWPEESHFGLRVTFFGEAFMNFGMAGVVGLGLALGTLFGVALRRVHLAAASETPSLYRNMTLLLALELLIPLANTSDAYYFWGLLSFYIVMWGTVVFPAVSRRSLIRGTTA